MTKVILTLLFLSLTFSLKESEVGVNDWSRLNIGEVTNVHFFNVRTAKMNAVGVKKPNVLFFQSSLNMIGHINKRNGGIDIREVMQEDEKVIDENENSIVLWSKGKQVVVYDTETMIRGTDNRLMKEEYSDINSYVQIK